MTVVDAHVHVYPEKIALRAAESVGDFYQYPMFKEGSIPAMLAAVEGSPITHHIIYSVATKPSNVESINDFIAAECKKHPNFIGFRAMHQDYPNPEAEIERAIGLGLRGMKLHPDTQKVNMDDDRLMRIYELIEGRMPLVMHCGDYRTDFSHPRRMKRILHEFPNLVVDAAHFGGWSVFDLAVEYLENENCFLDMSSSQKFLGRRRTRELCEIYGADRILFGSDFPMWDPAQEFKMFESLDFPKADFEKMTWHNAERFIGMDIR
mgnify:FL=1